jgi:hypothetical protein
MLIQFSARVPNRRLKTVDGLGLRTDLAGTLPPFVYMIWRPVRIVITFLMVFTTGMSMANSAVANPYSPINISLSEADDGSTIDVVVGTNLNVFLKVPPQEVYRGSCQWSNITMSGDASLQEIQRKVLLPTGVTAAFFHAIRPGLVQLRSHRYDCSRRSIIEWSVSVRVA